MIVKTKEYDNAQVNIHDDFIPTDNNIYRENLKRVYDTINYIFQRNEVLDKVEFYYSDKEIELLKMSGKYKLIE